MARKGIIVLCRVPQGLGDTTFDQVLGANLEAEVVGLSREVGEGRRLKDFISKALVPEDYELFARWMSSDRESLLASKLRIVARKMGGQCWPLLIPNNEEGNFVAAIVHKLDEEAVRIGSYLCHEGKFAVEMEGRLECSLN